MKKITLLISITLFGLNLNAQSLLPIKYGFKIGTNISDITSTPNDGVEKINSSALIGVFGGLYIEIPLNNKWHLKPELTYSQKGAKFTYSYTHDYATNERDLHNSSHELNLAYIELNPSISYKTNSKLSFNFGPSLSYLIALDYSILSDIGTNDEDLHEILPIGEYTEETFDIGLNIAISYYLTEDFLIEGKINRGFMSIGEVSKVIYTGSTGNDTKSNIYKLKNSGIGFSIAYLF